MNRTKAFRGTSPRWMRGWGMLVVAVGLTGCLGNVAKRLADREVYPIIEQKQVQALGRAMPFSIDPTTSSLTAKVMAEAGMTSDLMSTSGLTISLADALALAIDNSTQYQQRKESLYNAALRLTDARHTFSPIFSGTLSALATRQPTGETAAARTGQLATRLGLGWLVPTGARITVGLTENFVHTFTGAKREGSGSATASIVQPLLEGAGFLVTLENLTQAERDMIYAVREFDRFRKSFIVDRVSEYYRLLQAANTVENEWGAYQRLIVARERAETMLQANRMAQNEVDQAKQDEIRARNRWISAQTDYRLQLDSFKAALGLPPELNIQPDRAELDRLLQSGLIELDIPLTEAERLALEQRLDLKTIREQVMDQQRRLKIAENALLPALDVSAQVTVPERPGNRYFDFLWEQRSYELGLDLELPLDRKRQRNSYRQALISLQAAERNARQLRNDIIVQVRRAYQNVLEARESFAIQQEGLRLAERRVENVALLLAAGRSGVNMRDQLEAEAALRDARNAVTRALVDYTIARLDFFNATETLQIDERGMWNERSVTVQP